MRPIKQTPIVTIKDLEPWQDPKRFIDAKSLQPNDASPVLAILTDSETKERCYQVVSFKDGEWLFTNDPANRMFVDRWLNLFPLNISR